MKKTQKHTPLKRPYVLTVAGLDPSAGAGLGADIKTIERIKCYGLAVCSGNTVQNDQVLSAVHWTDLGIMKAQIELLFSRFKIDFVKIGVIQNWLILQDLVELLCSKNPKIKIILDPVLSASSSFNFHQADAPKLMHTLSKIYLLTPNLIEFNQLTEGKSKQEQIKMITQHCNLLIKGGHAQDKIDIGKDLLYLTNGKQHTFNPKRLSPAEKHGSGCILSAAITSYLALGEPLMKACYKGKKYTENALSSNKSLLAYHF